MDMNPVFTSVTRREPIPGLYTLGGSPPASLLATVTEVNTGFMSLECVQHCWPTRLSCFPFRFLLNLLAWHSDTLVIWRRFSSSVRN